MIISRSFESATPRLKEAKEQSRTGMQPAHCEVFRCVNLLFLFPLLSTVPEHSMLMQSRRGQFRKTVRSEWKVTAQKPEQSSSGSPIGNQCLLAAQAMPGPAFPKPPGLFPQGHPAQRAIRFLSAIVESADFFRLLMLIVKPFRDFLKWHAPASDLQRLCTRLKGQKQLLQQDP